MEITPYHIFLIKLPLSISGDQFYIEATFGLLGCAELFQVMPQELGLCIFDLKFCLQIQQFQEEDKVH